jgi:hypothetical protein
MTTLRDCVGEASWNVLTKTDTSHTVIHKLVHKYNFKYSKRKFWDVEFTNSDSGSYVI